MNRLRFRLVVIAISLLLSARAEAFNVGGSINTGYWRSDSWSEGGHSSAPVWDYGGTLTLDGSPIRRDLLALQGMIDYRHSQTVYDQGSSSGRNLSYQGSASLFGNSPVRLGMSASRANYDFTNNLGSVTTGSSLITTAGLNGSAAISGLPALTFSFAKTQVQTDSFASPRSTSDSTALAAGASQSLGIHDYSINYGTSWNQGSYTENNYRNHIVNIQENSRISKDLEFWVRDDYLLRTPTVDAAANPRVDDNNLALGSRWRLSPSVNTIGSYFYRRGLVSAPSAPSRESISQGVSSTTQYQYSRRLSFNGDLGFSHSQERLDSARTTSAGEQTGGGVSWSDHLGAYNYGVGGNANVGLIQVTGAGTQGAYGASLQATLATSRPRWAWSLAYSGSYARNLSAYTGWLFRHQVSGTADVDLGGGVRMQNSLTASSDRQDDPLLGTSLNRNLNLTSTTSYRRYYLQFNAGMLDGLDGARGKGISDGLFIPVEFNTHSRFASVTLSTQFARNFFLSSTGRYVESSAPSRPTQHETGVSVNATYTAGAFALSVEDQYSTGGTGDISQRGNLLMARISRSFGASF